MKRNQICLFNRCVTDVNKSSAAWKIRTNELHIPLFSNASLSCKPISPFAYLIFVSVNFRTFCLHLDLRLVLKYVNNLPPSLSFSLCPGCSPAAGVWNHPESRERGDTSGHRHGHLLPGVLGSLRQCSLVHFCQSGNRIWPSVHDCSSLLRQECCSLQPSHLHSVQQTGNWYELLSCI